jgi:hypothetical protein
MTVIRRLDAVLEPTKQDVLAMKARLDKAGITNQDAALKQASGQAFYNTSPFCLRDLKSRAKQQQLKADFEAYRDGFSANVQEILDKFKFRNQIPTLVEADILGGLLEKFLDKSINLSPIPCARCGVDDRCRWSTTGVTGIHRHRSISVSRILMTSTSIRQLVRPALTAATRSVTTC